MNAIHRRDFFATAALGAIGLGTDGRAESVRCTTGCVKLSDGRRLAYQEYGNRSGTKVVIHHHSLPASRREAEVFLPQLKLTPGVRLISFDRPGFGDSESFAERSFCGWVPDLTAAADALGISRFAITAISGGTPYALAFAIAKPERITRISIGSAAAEHVKAADNGASEKLHHQCKTHPKLAGAYLRLSRNRIERHPERAADMIPLVPRERELQKDPAQVAFIAMIVLNSLKQGPEATVQEAALLACPWGLALGEVKAPTTLWHGQDDPFATPRKSAQLAREIPGAECHLSPGDGHLSLVATRAAEIWGAATA